MKGSPTLGPYRFSQEAVFGKSGRIRWFHRCRLRILVLRFALLTTAGRATLIGGTGVRLQARVAVRLHPCLPGMTDLLFFATDWLAWDSRPLESTRADETELGTLILALADVEHLEALAPPRPAVFAMLRLGLEELPPQWHYLPNGPTAQWLLLVSLAEHRGAWRLAGLLLTQLERLLTGSTPSVASTAAHEIIADGVAAAPSAAESLALCWTRRGRIARMAGQLADAAHWYAAALRSVSRLGWQDARPQAHLGLAALALTRGNVPAAERALRPLLAVRLRLPALYQIPAHQLIAVAKRKRGLPLDALLHAWAAFDLLKHDDFRRDQLVCTMSEIALEAGDPEAALRGFRVVLASQQTPLVRLPALYGIARVLRLSPQCAEDSQQLATTCLADVAHWLTRTLAPSDVVLLHMTRAELWTVLGDHVAALDAWTSAGTVAERAGLFERQFTIAAIRDQLARESAAPTLGTAPGDAHANVTAARRERTVRSAPQRHPALRRLLTLR